MKAQRLLPLALLVLVLSSPPQASARSLAESSSGRIQPRGLWRLPAAAASPPVTEPLAGVLAVPAAPAPDDNPAWQLPSSAEAPLPSPTPAPAPAPALPASSPTPAAAPAPALAPAAPPPPVLCRSKRIIPIRWQLYMAVTSPLGDNMTVPCGSTLVFDWQGEVHGVALLPSFRCPDNETEFVTVPGGSVSAYNTLATFKTTEPGTLFFSCQVPGHCQSGQILQVNVEPSS